jgi:CheY-like chemotaxis protein
LPEALLVLVVEDDPRTQKVRKRQLERSGFGVLLAGSKPEALRELDASPHVDAVLTDASLDPENPADRSGIELAAMIRQRDADLPIMGYSAQMEDRPLAAAERALFTYRVPKAIMTPAELGEHLEQLHQVAQEHRAKRIARAHDAHEELRGRVRLQTVDPAETVRRLLPDDATSGDVEHALRRAGYRLQLVHSAAFRREADPVLVWTREAGVDGEAEAEVYAQPALYSHGETVQVAVSRLVDLMRLFAEDFRASSAPAAGPAQRLQVFLERTIEPRAEA